MKHEIETSVVIKKSKVPNHWSSAVPLRYKRNAINGDLNRAKHIASDFQSEVVRVKQKYTNVNFPINFTQSVINNFMESNSEENIVPNWLFLEDVKPLVYIRLPFCSKNEQLAKSFRNRLTSFTNDKIDIRIIWETKKIRSLFPLKDKVNHVSNVIYEGKCSCGLSYIGETKRNVDVRIKEHCDIRQKSEPAKHLYRNPLHTFDWKVICKAPMLTMKRKILEAYHIMSKRPVLNKNIELPSLTIFRHGIT